MFRGSGHYRDDVDSDDSYSSSSGEESLSDSSKRKPPNRPQNNSTEPRKVKLVRDALDTAYRTIAMLEQPLDDVSREATTPWKDLGQALRTISEQRGDARVRAALDVDTLSLPLFLTIQHDIAPFGNNKQYTRTLSKGEARATYSVMRRWPDLCPRADHMNMKQPSPSTPKWLLLQLFRFSLAPKPVLTLANLPPGTIGDAVKLDIALSCRLLKISAEPVLGLDLTGNELTSFPVEFLSTFPSLEGLALSHNPIEWLPISILKHPLRRLMWSGARTEPPEDLPQIIRDAPKLSVHPRPPRHRSLVQFSLMALKRISSLESAWLGFDLTPRMEELVNESYECELCDEMCAIRGEDWLEKQKLQWKSPGAGPVGLEGRLCHSCLVFLTVEERSSN